MNPIAKELNDIILDANPHIYDMLSRVGKELYFPRGILSQSAEAKEKAHKYNATIGMATEKGRTMCFPSVMNMIQGLEPEESITYAPSYGIKPLRELWKETERFRCLQSNSMPSSVPWHVWELIFPMMRRADFRSRHRNQGCCNR